jgi:hypothetical protein
MRITKLSLTNFRSFKNTQTIEFAPLTLFFGPNSVGKSNALLALSYVEHILKTGDCNPNYIEKFGSKLVGGYKGLVYKRDIERDIEISIEFDKSNKIGKTYSYLRDFIQDPGLQTSLEVSDVQTIEIQLIIGWSKILNKAIVKEYGVSFDSDPIFRASSDNSGKQPKINLMNFFHPVLIPENRFEELTIFKQKVVKHYEAKDQGEQKGQLTEQEMCFDEDGFLTNLHSNMSAVKTDIRYLNKDGNIFSEPSISYSNVNGALPKLNSVLQTSLNNDDEQSNLLVHELLTDIVVSPLDNLLSLLNSGVHIGPLRHIESSLLDSQKRVNANWFDGSAAWPELVKQQVSVIKEVKDWMSSSNKLNLGISIEARLRIVDDSIYPVDVESKNRELEIHRLLYKMKSIYSALCEHESSKSTFLSSLKEYFNELDSDVSFADISSIILDKEESNFQFVVPIGSMLEDYTATLDLAHFINFHIEFLTDLESDKMDTGHIAHQLGEILSSLSSPTLDYTLWDIDKNMSVEPSDIGVGISQLKPLIIASLLPSKKFVSIEQPELHVHPRIQTATADLLIASSNKTSFMIETHSEHLLLRLLKRIRQTTDNELPDNDLAISPEKVSIVYFEADAGGVRIKRIRIDNDGEFIDRWPHGFFSERRDEVM